MFKVLFNGCSDAQAEWGRGEDPRDYLQIGRIYTVHKIEIHSWHTLWYIFIEEKELAFNSCCFERLVEV